MFVFAYAAYLSAELFHFSGIIRYVHTLTKLLIHVRCKQLHLNSAICTVKCCRRHVILNENDVCLKLKFTNSAILCKTMELYL